MKILLLDVETAPAQAYIWSLWDKFVPLDRVIEPGYTLCWAAKWVGQRDVMFASTHHNGPDEMLAKLYALMNEADAIITYNGDRFDLPTINKELLERKWGPAAPTHSIDLYKTVKREFRLLSNKLDFVCKTLGLGTKVKHKGMELWKGCMDNDPASWRTMRTYNIRDVKLLEKLYHYLLPWIKQHPNHGLYTDADRPVCPNCGSSHVQSRGFSYTKTLKYHRWHCQSCGTWMRSRTNCSTPKDKANVLVKQ